jgi:uncharacterized protein
MRALVLIVVAGLALAGGAPAQTPPAGPAFPALRGRVVDTANLLSPAEESGLSRDLAALEDRTNDQLVIATVPTLGGRPISDYALALSQYWSLGHHRRGNGVLILIVPEDHQMRIQVGFGLTGVLTDSEAKAIIDRDMLPHFRLNEWYQGISAGTHSVIQELSPPR